LLEDRDYDLLIADARLRDGIGMALADSARRRGIPTPIMTGYAFVLRGQGIDLAQYDVLLKPIALDELLTTVAKILGEC
jgi:DNA-binding response OmpR family regulator